MARKNTGFTKDFRSLSKNKSHDSGVFWPNLSKIFHRANNDQKSPLVYQSSRGGRSKKDTDTSTKLKREPKQDQVGVAAKSTKTKKIDLTNTILKFALVLLLLPIKPLQMLFKAVSVNLTQRISRATLIRAVFALVFVTIVVRIGYFQVFSNEVKNVNSGTAALYQQIVLARRGQIYVQDLSQSKSDIAITSSQSLAHVWFNPTALKQQIERGYITLEIAASRVAGALNLPYTQIFNIFKTETERETTYQYVVIPEARFIDSNQKKAVEYLRDPIIEEKGEKYVPPFSSWLGLDPVETRVYPEGQMLASTLGFVPKYLETRDAAIQAGCSKMVESNESRGTVNTSVPGNFTYGQYTVGYYGLEQKYCSELAGLNGRKPLNRELGSRQEEEAREQNGASLFLTIDRNLQRKAEEVLAGAVQKNTNAKGGPQDGAILIMEVKTGKILAMASYPNFDPNDPGKADIRAFRNSISSVDYEVGSVLKPLTVAMALNEYYSGNTNSKGERAGVPYEWKFDDYDKNGKPYQENNGNIFYIKNADSLTFGKNLGLSEVLRDSINTGIAEILPTVGNAKTKEYFEQKFQFGKETLVDLPGDAHGNIRSLSTNINSDFSYATHGFGQGFTMSVIQLARAYSALGNNGQIVEPYLVDKIVYGNGRVDDGKSEDSVIKRPSPYSVFSPDVSRKVTEYMVNTIDQGYKSAGKSKGYVDGYTIAGKTGTAQVARSYQGQPCNYDCNTALGIYDHTFVGYGPASNPQILVIVKLSEPRPGEVKNYAENTLGESFSSMTKYTMEYLGIPRDR